MSVDLSALSHGQVHLSSRTLHKLVKVLAIDSEDDFLGTHGLPAWLHGARPRFTATVRNFELKRVLDDGSPSHFFSADLC